MKHNLWCLVDSNPQVAFQAIPRAINSLAPGVKHTGNIIQPGVDNSTENLIFRFKIVIKITARNICSISYIAERGPIKTAFIKQPVCRIDNAFAYLLTFANYIVAITPLKPCTTGARNLDIRMTFASAFRAKLL